MGVNRGFYEVADAGEIFDPMPDACMALQRITQNGRIAGRLYVFKQSLVWAEYGAGPGHIFYVDPASGKNTWTGTTSDDPVKTITYAHDSLVVDGRGDQIGLINFAKIGTDFVENVVITKSMVEIVAGIPVGGSRYPTIAPTTGIALDVRGTAFGFNLRGVRCYSVDNLAMKLAADGCKLIKSDFSSDTTHGLSIEGHASNPNTVGSGLLAYDCMFRDCGGNGIRQGGATGRDFYATNVTLSNCKFNRNTDSDIKDAGTSAGATYFYQWLIERCAFLNRNKTNYLDMQGGGAAQDSMIRDCDFGDATLNNVKIKIPSSGFSWVRNYDSTGHVAQATIT